MLSISNFNTCKIDSIGNKKLARKTPLKTGIFQLKNLITDKV